MRVLTAAVLGFVGLADPFSHPLKFAGPAAAQTPCTCDETCAGRPDPMAGLRFDTAMHRDWYRARFWSGECVKGLPFCWSGKSWWDVMALTLDKIAPQDRPQICARLFSIGVRVGHEWSRDNDIRKIHSRMFKTWSKRLRQAKNPVPIIDEIEAELAQRLGP